MVHQSFTTSSSVKHSHKLLRLLLLIFCGSAIIATCLLFIFSGFKQRSDSPDPQADISTLVPDSDNPSASEESDGTEKELPDAVDFSLSVRTFLDSSNGKKSVIIYDLDRQEIAFDSVGLCEKPMGKVLDLNTEFPDWASILPHTL